MKSKIKFLFLPMLAFLGFNCMAQQAPTFSFSIENTYQSSVNLLDTIWGKSYVINLNDTNDVAMIHMKMGTTTGGSDIFNHSIDYDQTGNLPVGFVYNRDGSEIRIKAGGYSYGFYYYEVKLEDDSSNVSQAQLANSSQY